jgi:hypothetical protein
VTKSPAAVQLWFFNTLVPEGTTIDSYLEVMPWLKSGDLIVTQNVDGAWDKYGAVWYPKINCYLPNIKHFQQMDDKDWAPSDALFGILHSRGQREDI